MAMASAAEVRDHAQLEQPTCQFRTQSIPLVDCASARVLGDGVLSRGDCRCRRGWCGKAKAVRTSTPKGESRDARGGGIWSLICCREGLQIPVPKILLSFGIPASFLPSAGAEEPTISASADGPAEASGMGLPLILVPSQKNALGSREPDGMSIIEADGELGPNPRESNRHRFRSPLLDGGAKPVKEDNAFEVHRRGRNDAEARVTGFRLRLLMGGHFPLDDEILVSISRMFPFQFKTVFSSLLFEARGFTAEKAGRRGSRREHASRFCLAETVLLSVDRVVSQGTEKEASGVAMAMS
ncbi:MAG: hypothetical protein M1818_003744 [Claussenomyces sp. TS43310]|nr:MAG: hypothetical protein M1818_003744 [Claussenomyces sp. TS43310]